MQGKHITVNKMKKPFSKMTPAEIEAIPDKEWKALSPFDKRSCYSCGHIQSAMSFWCTSPEAKAARGTSIPGVIKCPFWKPDWKQIPKKFRTKENGYVPPIEVITNPIKDRGSWLYRLFKGK